MNLYKILLLSSMALAATTFAMPATASATQWTHDDEVFEALDEFTQSFEGPLRFNTAVGGFGCETTVTLTADSTATAAINAFTPTTSTCTGSGAFAGCQMVSPHTTNLPGGDWTLHAFTNGAGEPELKATNTNAQGVGDLEIHNFYAAGCGVGTTTRTLFSHILFEPVFDEDGTIETLILTGSPDTTELL